MTIFEHVYNGETWYCVPASNHDFFEIGSKSRAQFGRRGSDWRYQFLKPNKNNITLMRLSNIDVPRYHLINCFMFKTESDAEKMLEILQNLKIK